MRRHAKVAFVVAALIAMFAFADAAYAATGYVPSGTFGSGPGAGSGEINTPRRIAVDQNSGDVYVVDSANNRVEAFDSAGAYLTEISGLDDPYGIAIDQSASPIALYVSVAGEILKLDSNGAPTPTFAADPGFTSPAAGTGSSKVGNFHAPLAVDPASGDLFVADRADNLIQRYTDAGVFVDAFNGADSPDGAFTGLEDIAAASGHVYVADARGGAATDGNPSRVLQFSTSGPFEQGLRPLTGEGDGLLAVDPNNGNVLIGDVRGFGARIHVFDASGKRLATLTMNTALLTGLAVDGAGNEDLYAAADDPYCGGACGPIGIQVLAPAQLPDATLDPVTTFDATSASFSGSVNPHGAAGTTANFEYSSNGESWTQLPSHEESTDPGLDGGTAPVALADSAKGLSQATTYFVRLGVTSAAGSLTSASQEFTTATIPAPGAAVGAPTNVSPDGADFAGTVEPHGFETTYAFEIAADQGPPNWTSFGQGTSSSTGAVAIAATRHDLHARTNYLVRVTATSAGGTTSSSEESFTTPASPPTVRAIPGSDRTTSTVRVDGLVNPHGEDTYYYFEYGAGTGYGSRVPVAPAELGDGDETVEVSGLLEGLAPGTTVHYRLVATSAQGTSVSGDESVSSTLSNRVMEMVSPVEKAGNEVQSGKEGTPEADYTIEASPDGNRVAYASNGVFPGSKGSATINYYLGSRDADSWQTTPLTPPTYWPYGLLGNPVEILSEDLSKSFVFSLAALDAGATKGDVNLYIANNLTGEYQYVGGAPATSLSLAGWGQTNSVITASSDLSHVVFHTQGSEGGQFSSVPVSNPLNLYESDATSGQTRLVNTEPGGSGSIGDVMIGLNYDGPNRISADGSRIFFLRSTGVGGAGGELYVRENGTVTRPISVSQRAGDVGSLHLAVFAAASRDGSVVFFSSKEPLTNDALDDHKWTLYRYDLNSDELEALTNAPVVIPTNVDHEIVVQGVAPDGNAIFFSSERALTPEAEEGRNNYYYWQKGIGSRFLFSGNQSAAGGEAPRVSPNGRYMAFSSQEPLTGYDTPSPRCNNSACSMIYLYDSQRNTLSCVSCPPAGGPAQGYLALRDTSGTGGPRYQARSILDDGEVFFTTRDRLVPEDRDSAEDVYGWRDGQLELISRGTATQARFADASADGSDVFFTTADRLVGIDTDNSNDLYDARLGGGIAAQNPPPTRSCEGSGCQPPAGAAPAERSVASGGPSEGNAKAPSRCGASKRLAVKVSKRPGSHKAPKRKRGVKRCESKKRHHAKAKGGVR